MLVAGTGGANPVPATVSLLSLTRQEDDHRQSHPLKDDLDQQSDHRLILLSASIRKARPITGLSFVKHPARNPLFRISLERKADYKILQSEKKCAASAPFFQQRPQS
jgi:hypothetical protein